MSCLIREGLSNTVNIGCMPSVTSKYLLGGYCDIIICKWQINGVDHYVKEAQATADCNTFGYFLGLWSTGLIPAFNTNDKAMLIEYIDSSVCGR